MGGVQARVVRSSSCPVRRWFVAQRCRTFAPRVVLRHAEPEKRLPGDEIKRAEEQGEHSDSCAQPNDLLPLSVSCKMRHTSGATYLL